MNFFNLLIDVLVLVVGVAAGYFFHRYQADQAAKAQQDKADNILKIANEQARLIESQARESATKIVQASEMEIKERRLELAKAIGRVGRHRRLQGRPQEHAVRRRSRRRAGRQHRQEARHG